MDNLAEMIEKSTSIVNRFYDVAYDYPVTYAHNTLDILKSGLLPWAESGIRKNIIIRTSTISQDQLTHEMSHFALRDITQHKPIPLWFDEGLACFVSGMNFIGSKENLKIALQKGNVPDVMPWIGFTGKLKWLHQMYVRKNTNLIYGLSYHLIEYLVQKYDRQNVLNFINSLDRKDFSDSFQNSFGLTQHEFYGNIITSLTSDNRQ